MIENQEKKCNLKDHLMSKGPRVFNTEKRTKLCREEAKHFTCSCFTVNISLITVHRLRRNGDKA